MQAQQEAAGALLGLVIDIKIGGVVFICADAVRDLFQIVPMRAQTVYHFIAVFVRDLDPEIFVEILAGFHVFGDGNRGGGLVENILRRHLVDVLGSRLLVAVRPQITDLIQGGGFLEVDLYGQFAACIGKFSGHLAQFGRGIGVVPEGVDGKGGCALVAGIIHHLEVQLCIQHLIGDIVHLLDMQVLGSLHLGKFPVAIVYKGSCPLRRLLGRRGDCVVEGHEGIGVRSLAPSEVAVQSVGPGPIVLDGKRDVETAAVLIGYNKIYVIRLPHRGGDLRFHHIQIQGRGIFAVYIIGGNRQRIPSQIIDRSIESNALDADDAVRVRAGHALLHGERTQSNIGHVSFGRALALPALANGGLEQLCAGQRDGVPVLSLQVRGGRETGVLSLGKIQNLAEAQAEVHAVAHAQVGVAVIGIVGTGHRFDVCVVGGDGGADLGKGRSLGINVAFRHVIGSVRLPHTVAGDVGDVRRGFGVADVVGVAEPFGGEGEALVLENHLEVTFLHQRAEVHAGDRLLHGRAVGGDRVGEIQRVVVQLGQHGLGIVVGAEPFDGKAHIQIVMGSAVIGKADGLVKFDDQFHLIAGLQNLVVNAGYRIDGRRVVVHIGDDRLGQRRVALALAAFIAAVVIGALQADGKVYLGRNFVAIVSDRAVASGKAFRVFCHVPAVDEEGGIVPSAPNPVSIGQHDSRGNIGRIVFQIKKSRLPGMLMLVIVKGSRDGGLQVVALHPQLANVHVLHIDLRARIDQIVFKG